MNDSTLYALDFDGVICDSAVETAITGWKAAYRIWQDMPEQVPPELIEQFRLVRPIIETGYEAILAMRLLYLREPIDAIYQNYHTKTNILLVESNVGIDDLKTLFGETRDTWIANDLTDWVNMNPLFTSIASKLQQLSAQSTWYIITTKQERFVKQILKANDIELESERIFGLDRKLNKVELLKNLLVLYPNKKIVFVEDRLPTLLNVLKTPELASIELVFALWGYNTAEDKALAAQHALTLQYLENFLSR
jgi:phosphoglycolate phosphatase-like HAD superfamily hydrolase